jgi:hypothetical protein
VSDFGEEERNCKFRSAFCWFREELRIPLSQNFFDIAFYEYFFPTQPEAKDDYIEKNT